MKLQQFIFLLSAGLFLFSCSAENQSDDSLFNGFVNPPATSRPYVRWWWNGNHVDKEEIARELEVLHKAGIGGVEINPIAKPGRAVVKDTKPLKWLSKEWNEMVAFASAEARKRGMTPDLLVGSGWPFGGEFLKVEETSQRIVEHKLKLKGGTCFSADFRKLYELSGIKGPEGISSLLYIALVPEKISSLSQTIDLTEKFNAKKSIDYTLPEGKWTLHYGIHQRNYRRVVNGALGAAGPVMNHYDKKVVWNYLCRLKKISEDTGIPLSKLFHALFCDSIELSGANWTDGMDLMFEQAYGYSLKPYFPFIFYPSGSGYEKNDYAPGFKDEISRVRYDFNSFQVHLFLENFTKTFQRFCTENGLKCKYQAYGIPWLMGLMDGSMIPDIPEGNNWLYQEMRNVMGEEWSWKHVQGYQIWNLMAASAGHLKKRKVVSNEAMTNTAGLFATTLDEIKFHDDMNFITGMNHSVLHGFNYSPRSAEFPGWIQYGTFFSEWNTWWEYFPLWADYNARLSYIFQNTSPVKTIAILPHESDSWADVGLARATYQTKPWYVFRIWEAVIQAGYSFDYLNESVLADAEISGDGIQYGPMSYEALMLCSVTSVKPETAEKIEDFVEQGGKLILVDKIPVRSLAKYNARKNDSQVKDIFSRLTDKYKDRVIFAEAPVEELQLLPWARKTLASAKVMKDVVFDRPSKNIFQIHTVTEDGKDIYFLCNSHRHNTYTFNATFPTGKKTPWIWNPEDGSRKVYPYEKGKLNSLDISLAPSESLLLVFEPELKGKPSERETVPGETVMVLDQPWHATFKHLNGTTFEMDFEQLSDFATGVTDDRLSSFSGTVDYTTEFNVSKSVRWLEIEKIHKGLAELYLNGKKVKTCWYGKPLFNIKDVVKVGTNRLTIRYVSTVNNYCFSLKDNPMAQSGMSRHKVFPSGLGGKVILYE